MANFHEINYQETQTLMFFLQLEIFASSVRCIFYSHDNIGSYVVLE